MRKALKAFSRAIGRGERYTPSAEAESDNLSASLDAEQQKRIPFSTSPEVASPNKNTTETYEPFFMKFAKSDFQSYNTFYTHFSRCYLDKTPQNETVLIHFLLHTDQNSKALKFLADALVHQKGSEKRINKPEAEKIAAALLEIRGKIIRFDDMDIGWRNSDPDSDYTHSSGSLADALNKLGKAGIKDIALRGRYTRSPKEGMAITYSPQVIRGEVSTYAQSMMGWFRFEKKREVSAREEEEDLLYIKEDAKIIRPHGIVGNLGKAMGDHLLPFSAFLKDIESKVSGKKKL